MTKARAYVIAAAAVFALVGVAQADEHSTKEPAAQQGGSAALSLAEKYPFLDPNWTSTSFYPPEYCRYLIRMDRSDAIYWQIKRWCDQQERRRR